MERLGDISDSPEKISPEEYAFLLKARELAQSIIAIEKQQILESHFPTGLSFVDQIYKEFIDLEVILESKIIQKEL
ncbi:MAG: hypothetical protein NVSMB46_05800 [Candidatus Saccharimonadales bacterium]